MSACPWNMKIFCHFRLYLHLKRRKRQIEATDGRGRARGADAECADDPTAKVNCFHSQREEGRETS